VFAQNLHSAVLDELSDRLSLVAMAVEESIEGHLVLLQVGYKIAVLTIIFVRAKSRIGFVSGGATVELSTDERLALRLLGGIGGPP